MNKKKILIVAIILVIAIAAYYYFKKPASGTNTPENKSLDKSFNVQVADTRNDNFPLNENSKGARVETVQRAANKLIEKQNALEYYSNYPVLVIDKIWGPKTTAAVIKTAGVGYYSGNGMSETQFNSFIEISNK